jgi:hypothetical protein
MEPILVTIVSALVAGAIAKTKDVGSQAVMDAYEGLKGLVVRKLGKGGAVQSVEDTPDSESARSALIEALAKKDLQSDSELKDFAERLERAITEAKAAAVSGTGDIEIEAVRGGVNAIVNNLHATGRIKLGPVVAEKGNAEVSNLRAGADNQREGAETKKG